LKTTQDWGFRGETKVPISVEPATLRWKSQRFYFLKKSRVADPALRKLRALVKGFLVANLRLLLDYRNPELYIWIAGESDRHIWRSVESCSLRENLDTSPFKFRKAGTLDKFL
jgi:hypothetical protein